MSAGSGDDLVLGEDGDDTIDGDGGNDVIDGGLGNDTIDGGADNDIISGDRGTDRIDGGTGNDVVAGGRDNDWLVSVAGVDQIFGEQGDDTVQIDRHTHATIEGGAGIDLLLIDDSQSTEQFLEATLAANTHTVADGATSTYSEMESITVILGSRTDTLTIHSTSAPVDIDASLGNADPDTLILDRTHDSQDRIGVLTHDTITGVGIDDISYAGIENLKIDLGSGSDLFTVQSTSDLAETAINGSAGDDTITIDSISSQRLTQINGDNGSDEAILRIPGNPGEFSQLGVGVERLVIDNRAAVDSVAWAYSDGKVLADGSSVVDALGAELVVFTAGVGAADSLVVEDNVDNPQVISIEDDQVRILEGIELLSQNSPQQYSFNTADVPAPVLGLAASRGIDSSPDGLHIYVAGGSHVAVYRRALDANQTRLVNLEFVQILNDGMDGVDGLAGAQDLVVSPDGRHVYVASSTDRSIVVFERVAATGRLIYKSRVHFTPAEFSGIEMGSDHVLYVTSGSGIVQANRDTSDGSLVLVHSIDTGHFITDLAVTPDGGDLYVASPDVILRYGPALGLRGPIPVGGNLSITATNTDVYVGRTDSVYRFDRNLAFISGVPTLHGTDVSAIDTDAVGGLVNVGLDTNTSVVPKRDVWVSNFVITAFEEEDEGLNDTIGIEFFALENGVFTFLGANNFQEGHVWRQPGHTLLAPALPINAGALGSGKQLFVRLTERDNPFPNGLIKRDLGGVFIATFDTTGQGFAPVLTPNILGKDFVQTHNAFQSVQDPSLFLDGVAYHDRNASLGVNETRTVLLVGTGYNQSPPYIGVNGNTSNFRYTLSYTVSMIPPQFLPPEIKQFHGNLVDTGIVRDPWGSDPFTGAARIDDITLTSDSISYYLDSSNASLHQHHIGNTPALVQGQVPNRLLDQAGAAHASTVVFGNTAYTLSSKLGTLTVTNPNKTSVNWPQRIIVDGLLDEASIAVSNDGRHLFVTNPTEDLLLRYNLDLSGTDTHGLVIGTPQVIRDGVDGAVVEVQRQTVPIAKNVDLRRESPTAAA